MIASVPDLLRLLAVPFFGYLAWRDVKTRRVPNRTWYPIAALALVLLAWETYATLTGDDVIPFYRRQFLLQVALSVGIVVPLSYAFWAIGGFGGADAKAFFVVAILFPTYPTYTLWQYGWLPVDALPLVETTVGVFSLTILSNTVIAGLAYPLVLAARNAVAGHRSPGMFVAKPIRWDSATEEYGSILRFPDRSILADLSPSGLRSYFAWRSLDLDALRMYLQWRGLSLAELRDDATTLRDPETLPAEPAHPGDGSIATDGGELDDPWGAEAFLADIQGSAYGTTPEELREGLDLLTSEDVVWISPGIPFLVPLFGGLVLALTYGDVLFALMEAIGLV